jgi:hypothetical protein
MPPYYAYNCPSFGFQRQVLFLFIGAMLGVLFQTLRMDAAEHEQRERERQPQLIQEEREAHARTKKKLALIQYFAVVELVFSAYLLSLLISSVKEKYDRFPALMKDEL